MSKVLGYDFDFGAEAPPRGQALVVLRLTVSMNRRKVAVGSASLSGTLTAAPHALVQAGTPSFGHHHHLPATLSVSLKSRLPRSALAWTALASSTSMTLARCLQPQIQVSCLLFCSTLYCPSCFDPDIGSVDPDILSPDIHWFVAFKYLPGDGHSSPLSYRILQPACNFAPYPFEMSCFWSSRLLSRFTCDCHGLYVDTAWWQDNVHHDRRNRLCPSA